MTDERIPFKIDIRRMLDLLAKQIYQSPLALLRENCQNAFDAVLQRRARGEDFEPRIDVTISRTEIVVRDNGIGMTRAELDNNFWTAGSSGKNTPEARAAGVVGTFGIGAMANFGIADALVVTTQAGPTGELLISSVRREDLSATESCIDIRHEKSGASSGTTVTASIPQSTAVDVSQAETYISEFVKHLDIPVYVNGQLRSQENFDAAVPPPTDAEIIDEHGVKLTPHVEANVKMAISGSAAEVWLHVTNLKSDGVSINGELLLKQGQSQIRTFRSRFALAVTAASSSYNFGGIVNLANLQPTAGREALTTESMQFLQTLIYHLDDFVSERVARGDWADRNTGFMTWAVQRGRFDQCGNITIALLPMDESYTLREIAKRSKQEELNYYEGADKGIRDSYATEERPLVVPSANNPRRQCQSAYVNQFSALRHVSDSPQILKLKTEAQLSIAETAFIFRVTNILEEDYFVKPKIQFGQMTHGLPFIVDTTNDLKITFDPTSGHVGTILGLYEREFPVFSAMTKDFLRSVIFPKIAHLVPSSTREGAEAFLTAMRRPREYLEYELAEADAVSAIIGDYLDGKITFREAAEESAKSAKVNYQVVDAASTGTTAAVIPDVVDNARLMSDESDTEGFTALPAITRMEKESPIKLLTIPDGEQSLKGYRCFIALAERSRVEHAEFFLQPHKTEIVWAGQKVLFIFQHHSGVFALYYELQGNELLSSSSGGGAFPTCTIAIKNQVYIPVPEALREHFIPTGAARKRFAVRSDLLFPDA